MNNDLIDEVKKGDDLACKKIIDDYRLMIYSIINSYDLNYGDYKVEVEDLFQEGCIGLIDACLSYKDNNNAKFSTYAYIVIERRIRRCFYKMLKPYKQEYSYDKIEILDHSSILKIDYLSDNSFNYLSDDEIEDNFIDTFKFANKEDKLIIKLKANDYTYKEIAEKLNITTKRVDNCLNRLKKKYKKYKAESLSISLKEGWYKRMEVSIEIDEVTNCLVDASTDY